MNYILMKTVIKSRNNKQLLKFSQDHQYKANFEKWVFTDESNFWFKIQEKRDGLWKERIIFNQQQKQGIKGFVVK